ncbi:MAG TPA: sodium:solute symporter [Vicinamibacterales bacterium]
MPLIDFAILVAYLLGTVLFGAWFSRSNRNVQDYFVSGRTIPWWAVMGSIVATETSTVTFISVPGFAFGGDFTFLQLVMGYMIGRIAVTLLFVPAYFRGELLTVYQLLGDRFGGPVKQLASGLFLTTRSLSDGFRLFATGLVLAALLLEMPGIAAQARATFPDVDPTIVLLAASVAIIGVVTIIYTLLGGMAAVVWTDVIQLVIYLAGALVALVILLGQIPGGWAEVTATAAANQKFRLFDFTFDLTRGYTFWSGLIGGAFLTTATHGTDQLMVQRYLCSRSAGEARRALLVSGVLVFAQFALFLLIGTMLYTYYTGVGSAELAGLTVDGRVQTDRVFPQFIVTHMPPGITGLVLAAIFAAAMSTLSSSLNSSAAAAVADFYIPYTRNRRDPAHYLRVSRSLTAVWGVVQIVVALAAIQLSRRVVDEVLGIASFTNGVILGVFLLGTLTTRVGRRGAFAGMACGAAVMLAVRLLTAVNWQWYVLIGSVTTFLVGTLASRVLESGDSQGHGNPASAMAADRPANLSGD